MTPLTAQHLDALSLVGPAGKKWGDLEFPLPFGRTMTSAEEHVHEMDGKTGASLKLSILNPKVPRRQGAVLVLGAGLLACMMAGQQPSVHSPSSREYARLGKGGYATNTRIAGLEASLTVRLPARPCLEEI